MTSVLLTTTMHRRGEILNRLMLIGSMAAATLVTSVSSAIGADITDPAVARKVARIELARSIRAFAASTLANGDCLVRRGRLSRQQADQAMPIALQEMGISPTVLANPQVRKAAALLEDDLDENCGLTTMDAEKARQLVNDEL